MFEFNSFQNEAVNLCLPREGGVMGCRSSRFDSQRYFANFQLHRHWSRGNFPFFNHPHIRLGAFPVFVPQHKSAPKFNNRKMEAIRSEGGLIYLLYDCPDNSGSWSLETSQ
jgi:hypothetical protein